MPLRRTAADLADLVDCPRRILAVFAHPDDESYGCAGALARYAQGPDAACVLLSASSGEASSMGRERGLSPTQVGALREERLHEVSAILGLDGLLLPRLPDSRLARLSNETVAAPIIAALDALRPQVVISHDPRGVNGHADHVAVHWAVRRALEGRDGVRFAMLAYGEDTAEAARPRVLFATKPAEIDASLTLTDAEIDAKEACLRVHEAIVTLRGDGDAPLHQRPPVELYDFFGEDHNPPLEDLI